MARSSARWLAAALPLVACAAPPDAPRCGATDFLPAPALRPVARLAFDPRGVSQEVTTARSTLALALDDPSRCVQVETAREGDLTLVEAGSRGPFCTRCEERQSVAFGGGCFPFLARGAPGGDALTVSFGLRDCAALTPSQRGASPLGATLWSLPPPDADPGGRAVLHVGVTAFGGRWGSVPTEAEALLREATMALSDAGITLRLAAHCAAPAPEGALVVTDHRHDALARWSALAVARCPWLESAPDAPRVPLLLVPCARRRDTLLGVSSVMDGYTTHLPGGVPSPSVPDAVVLSSGCGATLPLVEGVPLGLARTLAHETGHYLGLYHPREEDGTEDTLEDTLDEGNLMHRVPLAEGARGLTPQQVAVVRRHPSLRWPREGSARCADP